MVPSIVLNEKKFLNCLVNINLFIGIFIIVYFGEIHDSNKNII